LSHLSGGLTWVDSSQHKIKVVIIIILKLNSRVNSKQGLDHRTWGLTWVDPGQCKDTSCYYHSFKTWFGGWLRQDPCHGSVKSTRVDLSQRINKNGNYNSFKTRLGNRPNTRFRSWVRRVNTVDPIFYKK
jgi:hypothetical protein